MICQSYADPETRTEGARAAAENTYCPASLLHRPVHTSQNGELGPGSEEVGSACNITQRHVTSDAIFAESAACPP